MRLSSSASIILMSMCVDLQVVLVVKMLLLPGGRGDGAVWVHDDFGTADDHGHQQQAEEGNACQSQALVHIHELGVWRCLLHRFCFGMSTLSWTSATILIIYLTEEEKR